MWRRPAQFRSPGLQLSRETRPGNGYGKPQDARPLAPLANAQKLAVIRSIISATDGDRANWIRARRTGVFLVRGPPPAQESPAEGSSVRKNLKTSTVVENLWTQYLKQNSMRKSITRRSPAKNISQEDLHFENSPYHMKIKTFQQGYNLSTNLLRKNLQLEVKNFSQKYNWGILVNQRIPRLWRAGGSLKCEHYFYQH